MKTFRIYYQHEDYMLDRVVKAKSKQEAKTNFEFRNPNCYVKTIIEIK